MQDDAMIPIDSTAAGGMMKEATIKNTYSLDFSLSPSSTVGEMAATPMSDENGDVSMPPSVEAAGKLVRRLLEQMAFHDSPPANNPTTIGPSKSFHKKPSECSSIRHFHRMDPLSELEPTTYSNLAQPIKTIGEPPSSLWDERIVSNTCLSQQGHVALATLCCQTLETIGLPHQIDLDERDGSVPTFVETVTETLCEQGSKEDTKNKHRKSSLSWMRRPWKKASSLSGVDGEFPKMKQTPVDVGSESENSIENTTVPAPVRLQMFGSEYARFLSTTPLAPEDLSSLPQRNPRPHVLRRRALTKGRTLETADKAVLSGAITDIIVTANDEEAPKGYYRVSQSSAGEPFLIHDRKTILYFHVKKETNWDRAAQRPCVTALAVIFPQRQEFVPPGFSVVRRQDSNPSSATAERTPANLNLGGTEPAYLCFRRSREGNPITSILPLLPSRQEAIPEGYTVLERTPRDFVACLKVSQNCPVFLAYRQRLANLEMLFPLPLVLSVFQGDPKMKQLGTYYATGGVVVESRVGRFHIMERSTHSLLSPGSISNRLSLIEASRQKALDKIKGKLEHGGERYAYSNLLSSSRHEATDANNVLTSSVLIAHNLVSCGSKSVFSGSSQQLSSIGDLSSVASSKVSGITDSSFMSGDRVDVENTTSTTGVQSAALHSRLYANQKKELRRCLEVMSFIPALSSGFYDNNSKGLTVFQMRVAVLTPVLTSAYTAHGRCSVIAVEGLTALLQEGFFADDVNMTRDSSGQTTLLDIAVQVVCDVATTGARETQLHSCVEYVGQAVNFGCGYLSTRSIGYIMRLYLFVFYFGLSIPTGKWGLSKETDQYFLEDLRTHEESILLGGAPQLAALCLKDLIVFTVTRLGSLVQLDQCALNRGQSDESSSFHVLNMAKNLSTSIGTPMNQVETANYTELAMHQIMKSGGSELFWYEMINACGSGLFGQDKVLRGETRHMYSLCFALLANCIKVALSKVRKNKSSENIPRDKASKLMAIEMVKYFLSTWEQGAGPQAVAGSSSAATFVFSIRRLVVPCLLLNTREALDDPRVFRRVIQVVGTLWCSPFYRRNMKLEIGLLFEHFVLRLLRLGPQILFKSTDDKDMTYLFAQQLELMKEIKNWFSFDTNGLLELFLNFDEDPSTQDSKEILSGIQWKVCRHLCSSLCIHVEMCTEFLAKQIRDSQSTWPSNNLTRDVGTKEQGYEGVSTVTLARESARRLRQSALDAIFQILQLLVQATALAKGKHFSSIVEAWLCGELLPIREKTSPSNLEPSETDALQARDDEEASRLEQPSSVVVGYWQRLAAVKRRRALAKNVNVSKERGQNSVRDAAVADEKEKVQQESVRRSKTLEVGFDIAKEKGMNKAIDYFVACNVLSASSRDIASFLRIHAANLRPSNLGNYLGEGGSDVSEAEYWNLIRYSYIRAISFVGLTAEQGLRQLLTQGGFRLPGEAQKIDRILSTFSQCYWEDNAGDFSTCPFEDQDTIYTLSFAIIMLNTDLHKANDTFAKTKKHPTRKKMTKVEFINNLRGLSKGCDIDWDYLSSIFDSIEANPILLNEDDEARSWDSSSLASRDLHTSIESMVDNAKSVDALLRGLSTHVYRYVTLEEYASMEGKQTLKTATLTVSRKFMDKTWHQFHGLVNSSLKIAHLDHKSMESCIDLLKLALFMTIVLDMPVERVAFLNQLGRFRLFNAWRTGGNDDCNSTLDQDSFKQEEWYKEIAGNRPRRIISDKSCLDLDSSFWQLEALEQLDKIVYKLGFTIVVDAVGRKAVRDAVRQLENGDSLLNDPNRTFIREGNLMKRANQTGRYVEYRFFLFSDTLIYAKKIGGSSFKYRVHEQLPLILMKVIDWFPPEMRMDASKRSIQIHHPQKKFLVLCDSHEERKSWVTDIRQAVDREMERKVAIAAARKAATTVPTVGASTISETMAFPVTSAADTTVKAANHGCY